MSRTIDEDIICPTCGRDDFKNRAGMKVHHSKIHNESISGVSSVCKHCGEHFEHKRVKRGKQFCSQRCYKSYQGEKHRVETRCAWCNKELKIEANQFERASKNFCGHGCYGEWKSKYQTGEEHPRWNKITVECAWCESEIQTIPYYKNKSERHFCDTSCMGSWQSENRTGQEHPLYDGGIVGEYKGSWARVRSKVRERDNHTCQICGATSEEIGCEPHCHHIKPVSEILKEGYSEEAAHRSNNLILLCPSCHPKVDMGKIELKSEISQQKICQLDSRFL